MTITHICFAPPFQEFSATWKSVNNDLETKSLANHPSEKDWSFRIHTLVWCSSERFQNVPRFFGVFDELPRDANAERIAKYHHLLKRDLRPIATQ